jgi:hypothetical protein
VTTFPGEHARRPRRGAARVHSGRPRRGGGADGARLDLRDDQVSGVDLASGVSTVELWLPVPDGTVVVTEAGGVPATTAFVPPDWARAAHRFGVRLIGGVSQFSLDQDPAHP